MTENLSSDLRLADWQTLALAIEGALKKIMVGQDKAIRLLCIATFARGHVILEGNVGVGKTTLLRALARTLGGGYERIEGTVDLMPSDLVYYTYVDADGKPQVACLASPHILPAICSRTFGRFEDDVHDLLGR